MVSEYDVFHTIATNGQLRIVDIVRILNKQPKEYHRIFNIILALEKRGYIERTDAVRIINNDKTQKLFDLIEFCIRNNINYNFLFKKNTLNFIQKAAKNEYFTIKDIRIHPQTFAFYVDTMINYGFIFLLSRKPLKCKLLRHHFLFDLLKFFKKKLKFYTPQQHSFIDQIKKELKKYRRILKIQPVQEKINFIYSSLALEGSPLTLPETQKLLLEDIVPHKHKLRHIQEVTNYQKSIDIMLASSEIKKKLDLPNILAYHKIAMSHIPFAGEIRNHNVIIKNNPKFKTADWTIIPKKLNHLMQEYDKFESQKRNLHEIIQFAAFFHNEFQRIHPFIDGNSRISRLLMLYVLRMHGIPLLELPIGFFDIYLDLTKRSTKRDDPALQFLIEELIFMNLKKLNKN